MSKKALFITGVVLVVSTVTCAGSFYGDQSNGAFRMGCFSTGTSVQTGATGYPKAGAAGTQTATTQGFGGAGVVCQNQEAAGGKYYSYGSQGQGTCANQGQMVTNIGNGSSTGAQNGTAGQTQAHYSCAGTAAQNQTASGAQLGTTMGTNCASVGIAGAMSGAQMCQTQMYGMSNVPTPVF